MADEDRVSAVEYRKLPTHDFLIYSRAALEASHPPLVPHVVISITGYDEKVGHTANVPTNEHTLGVHREVFADVSRTLGEWVRMTPEQAEHIVDFVRSHQERLQLVIVHCQAGISRSSAIALGLQLLLDNHIHTDFRDRYVPNLHVLRLILNAGLRHLDR